MRKRPIRELTVSVLWALSPFAILAVVAALAAVAAAPPEVRTLLTAVTLPNFGS